MAQTIAQFYIFLHLHLLLEHLDLQEHFKNPCPPDKDWLDAASRTLMVVSIPLLSAEFFCNWTNLIPTDHLFDSLSLIQAVNIS